MIENVALIRSDNDIYRYSMNVGKPIEVLVGESLCWFKSSWPHFYARLLYIKNYLYARGAFFLSEVPPGLSVFQQIYNSFYNSRRENRDA